MPASRNGYGKMRIASATLALTLVMGLALFLMQAYAGHDEDLGDKHKKESRKSTGEHKDKKHAVPLVPGGNTSYKQECGACHHAYFPGLLPGRSWEKLLANPSDHFSEQLSLSSETLADVRTYLLANSADNSGNKRSRKIMKSIGSSTPLRLSDIVYLRDKHHELSKEVFQCKSVGGFGNCIACHKGAALGNFNDNDATVPK